jgi:hypothetical protein
VCSGFFEKIALNQNAKRDGGSACPLRAGAIPSTSTGFGNGSLMIREQSASTRFRREARLANKPEFVDLISDATRQNWRRNQRVPTEAKASPRRSGRESCSATGHPHASHNGELKT